MVPVFTYPDVPQDFIEALKKSTHVVIVGHLAPDGDCLHSELAMQWLLTHMGKEVFLANSGPFDRPEISYWSAFFRPTIPQSFLDQKPLVVITDCSSLDRIGENLAQQVKDLEILIIDHHSSGSAFGTYKYIVPQSYSTTLVIQHLYETLGVTINEQVARHLFFGFATDTGFFRYIAAERGETLRMAADLVDAGVSPNEVYDEMTGGKELASIKYLARLIERTETLFDGKILVSHETEGDVEEFGSDHRPSDALYAALLSVRGVQAVLFFKISDSGKVEIGFRASHASTVDVGQIAADLGGGGHKKAAGATVDGSYESIRPKVIEALRHQLQ